MNKAIVIFSGGQDSTTCLYYAIQRFGKENVEAITFVYGQRHKIEVECAKAICEKESVPQTIVDISFLGALSESAMVVQGKDINATDAKGLPASFVPNRNQLLITIAHAYAQKVGADSLVTGVCQTDFSGYPDCREGFIEMLQNVSNLGSKSEIKIYTPIMHIDKKNTWALADELGHLEDVRWLSHTCYEGDRENRIESGYGCGVCGACVLREKGYKEYIATKEQK